MTELYNQATATHYSAYRPPLHQVILGHVLSAGERFPHGLDVGCGTGYSAVALAAYCQRVYGVEPSQSMLDEALPHPKISYLRGDGGNIPLKDGSVDVATFAGSLSYAKSAALLREMKRVCRPRAVVISYDFKIVLLDHLLRCGMSAEGTPSDYDYAVNFSDCPGFRELFTGSKNVRLDVTAAQLAHIVLSESHLYVAFAKKYGVSEPFASLRGDLEATGKEHVLEAKIYFAKYELTTW